MIQNNTEILVIIDSKRYCDIMNRSILEKDVGDWLIEQMEEIFGDDEEYESGIYKVLIKLITYWHDPDIGVFNKYYIEDFEATKVGTVLNDFKTERQKEMSDKNALIDRLVVLKEKVKNSNITNNEGEVLSLYSNWSYNITLGWVKGWLHKKIFEVANDLKENNIETIERFVNDFLENYKG